MMGILRVKGLNLLIAVFLTLSLSSLASAQTINVVARAGIYYDTISAVAPEFEKETGIRVNTIQVGRDGYLQKVSTQLLAGSSAVDVVVILSNFVGQFGGGGQFEALDRYLTSQDFVPADFSLDNFIPASLEALSFRGNLYALPMDVSTMFLFYRTDLIQNPPETWDEYLEVAKSFTRSINPNSPTEFGTTFQGKRGETQPKDWYQYFWSMGGRFFDENMRPMLDSQEAVKALEFVVALYREHKVLPPDITVYEFPEVLSAFQNQKVAMAIEWNSAYPQLMNKNVSPHVFDRYAITLIPGVRRPDGSVFRTPFMHTWALAVNAASRNKEAAAKFVAWLTSPRNAKTYALRGGIPAVRSVLEDPEVVAVRPEFPKLLESFEIAYTEPALPEWPRVHEYITEAITVALAGEKTPREALQEANRQITELMRSRGYIR